MTEAILCRVCKKRPVPERKPWLVDENSVDDEENRQALREINEKWRRNSRGLCYECQSARTTASIDQSIAYMKEKSSLGQCIIQDCTESRTETERCVGHQAQWDAS